MRIIIAALLLAALAACNGPGSGSSLLPQDSNVRSRASSGYQLLYSVNGKTGGGLLWGGVAVDAAGNIFGAAMKGGPPCILPGDKYGCGIAFELVRSGSSYQERVLHDFGGPTDGVYPESAPVLLPSGALVGTTIVGGPKDCRSCGTAYELTPSGNAYSERVIHYFSSDTGGNLRYARLTPGKDGALYGVTVAGGPNSCGCGAVFALVPWNSAYRLVVLHVFNGNDGAVPLGPLTVASDGTIYGTTLNGGTHNCNTSGSGSGCGVIFAIVRTGHGYQERVVHDFSGAPNDGANPDGNLAIDASGTIYGTAEAGGGTGCRGVGCGIAYSFARSGAAYRQTIIYRFRGGNNASIPRGGLVYAPGGRFFGVSDGGGRGGAIFELWKSNGKYLERVVHQFGSGNDGSAPEEPLYVASDGSLYGTTLLGGTYGVGTVFKYTP